MSKSIARALDFDAKVVSNVKMRPLAGTLKAKTRDICEKLFERSLTDDDWTRMKLPTSLGGKRLRAVTSQLEVSFDTTKKKTRDHAERIERNLTGKRERPYERNEHEGKDLRDGTDNIERDDTAEAMTGPFKWDLLKASKGFSIPISPTLKTHEIITLHTLWSRLNTTEKAAFLANANKVLEPPGLGPLPTKGCRTVTGTLLPDEDCASG